MELFKIMGTVAVNTANANKSLDDVTRNAETSQGRMVNTFKKIGAAVATYFAVDKIIGFGKACIDAAATVSAQTSAFEQIMGDYADEAAAKVGAIADATGMVDSRLTPYMTSMTAKFQGLGFGIEESTDLASDGLNLAADAAAFWDKSLDQSMSALNSFINGNYEGGESIGLFANETTLATWAAENLGLEWDNLTEKDKQFARLEFAKAMQEASGVTGQAAKESEQYANVQANLTEKWKQFKAQIGEPLLQNIVLPAMNMLIGIVDNAGIAFENLTAFVQEHQELMTVLAIAVGTLTAAIILNNSVNAIRAVGIAATATAEGAAAVMMGTSTLALGAQTIASNIATAATTALGVAFNFLTSPITLVVLAIGALIAIIVLCVKHWDEIKAKALEVAEIISQKWQEFKDRLTTILTTLMSKALSVWESIKSGIQEKVSSIVTTVQEKFQAIKDAITEKIEAARDKVRDVIEVIKGFFDFEFKWPNIPLPHFSISPAGWQIGDLLKGVTPSLGVEWYAKGGILTKPTIFGINGNNLMVGGEAGKEAVAPIETLQAYVAAAVASQNEGLIVVLSKILDAIIAMDENMGGNLREALDGVGLDINNREFARIVRTVI